MTGTFPPVHSLEAFRGKHSLLSTLSLVPVMKLRGLPLAETEVGSMPEDGLRFPVDFLNRIGPNGEVDELVLRELLKLTPDQREELAYLLLQRDAEDASN